MSKIVILLLIFILWVCFWLDKKHESFEMPIITKKQVIDLNTIKKRKKLVALTRYNANSFFIYKGQPMGYEYELLNLFAKEINVDLEIKIPSTYDSLFIMLENGDGDLIAANLLVTQEISEKILFAKHHNTTRQVLVQRLPENYKYMNYRQKKKAIISDPIELIGKTVTVPATGAFRQRLKNLSNEIGGDIIINLSDIHEPEDLIGMVSRGEIEYTIADENLAKINSSFHKNIDVSVPISFSQRIAWAFRSSSLELKEAADNWIAKINENSNPLHNIIYDKYYGNSSLYNARRNSEYFVLETEAISPYDSLFKKYEILPIASWTLLASMAYQESKFDNSQESWAGAKGIMQVLPQTGMTLGFKDISTPENNIKAGVKYLQYIYDNYWKNMADTNEIVKFMLGSYNAGIGHIKDAQRLAARMKLDSLKWDNNVAVALRKLSNPEYYYRPEVKYGYCRGDEPFFYVKEIIDRKRMYDGILEATAAKKSIADSLKAAIE
ncbi:MAG: transporter substrate-binding domain-containing protein [Chitinispirillales bacterium]|jgi:membrane-bound lytic murein transglycosylase F|nr:transporter substrate-binding domain-containing protein [Chitinispirillales bacterium]